MCVTYECNVSVCSSKWKDLHTWNICSLVFPIFEYCCLIWFCKPNQCTYIYLWDSYQNLASPTNVRQNLWTFTPSWNWYMSIQSFILSRCASASSSGFPKNSGLKCDEFNCGMCCTSYAGCCGWGGWVVGGAGTAGACGPASAIFILYYVH